MGALAPRGRLARAVAVLVAVVGAAALLASPLSAAKRNANVYTVTNLVSNGAIPAAHVDPNLVNAWGLAALPTSPWWVANADSDTSTLYNAAGVPFPPASPLVVTVEGGPTGEVANGGSGFVVHNGMLSGPARFIWATESGFIRGWNPTANPTVALVGADRSDVDANYKGLTIATTASGTFLYAADFHNGRIDVFDSNFDLVPMPGAFTDPTIPNRFAPFGIQTIGNRIFVAYAQQDEDAEDEVTGATRGWVDVFDTSGNLLGHVARRSRLNAPWGLALAPMSFGKFAGDVLVGNFGDGRINAYREVTPNIFVHEGMLRGADGDPLSIDGLWSLQFGNGSTAGPTDTLFFTAGPNDEEDGLFGSITAG
jgi:uncharacterized protein (TIGR03118 family)